MLKLKRFLNHSEIGTFGELYKADELLCKTVEAPWLDNRPFKSCIPAGLYSLVKRNDNVYMHNLALNVDGYNSHSTALPMRYACTWHVANLAKDLKGCIAPGRSLQILDNQLAVKYSAAAWQDIHAELLAADYLVIEWI